MPNSIPQAAKADLTWYQPKRKEAGKKQTISNAGQRPARTAVQKRSAHQNKAAMYSQTAATKAKATSIARTTLITGTTLACIFLFVYTAQAKLLERESFQDSLQAIPYIERYAGTISWLVPITELCVALLLIVPGTQRLGLLLFVAVMATFTIYIASMLLWAEKLPCSCGGAIEKLSWNQHIWFNLGFIALAIVAAWLKKQPKNSSLLKSKNNGKI